MNKEIYLDHAATTRMWPGVKRVMEPFLQEKYRNASAHYSEGKKMRETVEESRALIAEILGAKPQEIYFTSGGSEADNWVIKGIAGDCKKRGKGNHIITDAIEHHAVLNSCGFLESLDYKVSYVMPDQYGVVKPEAVASYFTPQTTLVSVMYANNEVGSLQPVEKICELAHRNNCLFHTDAVQAVGHLPISLKREAYDCLSASAHKFHGPKGVGFLFVRDTVEIPSFIHGGSQESGKRAGTENVAGIVGMAEALRLSSLQMEQRNTYVRRLRDYFQTRILKECEGVRLNGGEQRLPGNLNVSFEGVDGQTLLELLDEAGISASAGSACNAGNTKISHVIEAMRVPAKYASGTVRFTLGEENTKQEVDYVVAVIKESLYLLRQI